MKAVVQRVASASVSVAGHEVSRIGHGLLILLAVGSADSEEEARWTAEKCAELRIFQDEQGKMNRSLLEIGGSALVVSQFTLYGDCLRGRRPSFTGAAAPGRAEELFDVFCDFMRGTGAEVQTGVFGEKMLVAIQNDGPVTLIMERENKAAGEDK
jgi:D-aminoacyl-tRNA deacylase